MEIWDFIANYEHSPVNAGLVDARILTSASRLETFPLIGKEWTKGRRLLPVPRTQYTIVYRVLARNIRILRVTHQKRKTPVA